MILPSHAPLAALAVPGQSGRRCGRLLPFAKWWRWRDFRQLSKRCTPCVLGAPPSCGRGGTSVDLVQRGEICQSDVYKGYVRYHRVDAKAASGMLADADAQPALQPGQKTARDING